MGSCSSGGGSERPSLVVLVVMDQFGANLVERYSSIFQYGFRRLLDEGYHFTRAEQDHAITNTSQGHTTAATGRFPAHHGIVDNSWYAVGDNGKLIGVVEHPTDSTAPVLGYPQLTGVSPRLRLTDGLGDWILAAHPKARAVTIAQGSGSAIGLAPMDPRGEVYWSSSTARAFVTSTYYTDTYPAWVERFNRQLWPLIAADSVWESAIPPGAESLARRDDVPYEGDQTHTTFPHRLSEETANPADSSQRYAWVRGLPSHDGIILRLVREAVTAERLGRRGVTDYLGVNLSSLDDVGHDYDPWSLEQLDALLRLDREIGELLTFLDAEVGAGRYVIAVTGDHGVATAPEYAAEIGAPGRRVTRAEIDRLIDAVAALGPPPASYDPALARRVVAVVERFDFVADAMTRDDLEGSAPADSFLARYRNSYRPDRVPWFPLRATDGRTLAPYGVIVRLVEGAMPGYATAVHGSPYDYDRRVPMMIFGAGVSPGSSDDRVRTVDLAPTLAALAGIAVPGDIDGRVVYSQGQE